MSRNRLLLLILLSLASCGYHWHPDFPDGKRVTLFIPYALGDEDGTFTAEVIRTLTSSGIANVSTRDYDYRLKIELSGIDEQTIGYRFDEQKVKGGVKKNIVGREGRREISATLTLFEGSSDTVASGPHLITVDKDFDYVDGDSAPDLAFRDPSGRLLTVLPFSLGQLEPKEAAQEAVTKPLYESLAKKAADTIFAIW